MAVAAKEKPSARTAKSEDRERAMRRLALRVLRTAGYQIVRKRTPAGQQFVDAKGPNGPITIWVKCAWAPGTHGYAAVQIDFPKDYEQTIDWAIQAVDEKIARTRQRGATHMMLLGADNSGKRATSAYLAKMTDVPRVFRQTAKIHPKMARNGKSPSLYVEGPTETHRKMIAPLAAASLDLLHENLVYEDQHGTLSAKIPAGVNKPERIKTQSGVFQRSAEVRRFVLRRAFGRCEYCGAKGFKTVSGTLYLETHHIVPLAKKGKDTVDNVIALCPSHHREAHHGERSKAMRVEMLEKFAG